MVSALHGTKPRGDANAFVPRPWILPKGLTWQLSHGNPSVIPVYVQRKLRDRTEIIEMWTTGYPQVVDEYASLPLSLFPGVSTFYILSRYALSAWE